MPGFRRWGRSKFERNPASSFKLLAAVLVITLYLLFKEFQDPTARTRAPTVGAQIQYAHWNGTGKAHEPRAKRVRDAMKHTFWRYKEHAWGCDDILPVSGGNSSRLGWGAFIVESASTLVLMELWEELALSVEHILAIDFGEAKDLVDPFETTIRHLGGLLSIVDMYDIGLIPAEVMHGESRDLILGRAVTLAGKLAPAYDTPTGMPWPRVDFSTGQGVPDSSTVPHSDHPAIGPARTGSSILENRVLSRLTGDAIYAKNATLAWAPLVWSKWKTSWAGMVDGPIDMMTGAPVGRVKHWDDGHASFYENLVKMTVLAPPSDPHLSMYKKRFLAAAYSLRTHLTSRSAPASNHTMQHLFLGRQDDATYVNQQSQSSCSAPSTLLLASQAFAEPPLRTFALALLEACHHIYTSTPTSLGPESWSWIPKFSYEAPHLLPETPQQRSQAAQSAIWTADPAHKARPEYIESLFYAWRITGQLRYREWAWHAFVALDTQCRAPFGFAQLRDVYRAEAEAGTEADPQSDAAAEAEANHLAANWADVQDGAWAAQTLKYFWLLFSDVQAASLDSWVFTRGGHALRMIR